MFLVPLPYFILLAYDMGETIYHFPQQERQG